MVLEEATSSSEPSPFSDDASQPQAPPPSDEDPYSGDRNPTVLPSRGSSYFQAAPGVNVNTNNLPKPFLVNRLSDLTVQLMQKQCHDYGEILGRPVRQEEADAITYNYATGLRTASFGPWIGLAIGCTVAYRGNLKKPFTFPGPKSITKNFNYDRFGSFQGRNARRAWQTARYAAVAPPIVFATTLVWTSYASTVAAVKVFRDPRLKELNEKLMQRGKQNRLERETKGMRKIDETPAQRDGETYDMARQRRNMQRMQQESRAKKGSTIDDASPTGGSFGDDFQETSNNPDTGLMSDLQASTAEQRGRQADASQRDPSRRFGDDDASRIARPDSSLKQSGSAWDRLRQQAISGQGQSPKAAQNQADDHDSFAFSNADEEKQLARREAQKEFDARIERERSGQDFDEQSRKGGWRR